MAHRLERDSDRQCRRERGRGSWPGNGPADGSSAASEQGSDDAEVDEEEAVLSRFESAVGRPMIGLDTESPPVRRRGA